MNVGFVHLGCSKNLIDTEIAIGTFGKNHYQVVNEPEDADMIVINTCGFIDSAKEEAINTILEMAAYKEKRCRYLVVMGCLAQRYYDELISALPEVDLFIKLEDYDNFWELIEDLVKRDIVQVSKPKLSQKLTQMKPLPLASYEEFTNRVISTGKDFAYLKIGEGCSNCCTYCAIPYIRGPFISRKKEEILEEAKELVAKGIKELIVIAQDTTKYGVDLYGESKLAELLEELCQISELKWIRFLYSYPEGITDELIEVVAKNEKIAKYFDIPIQHVSDSVLKRMNRKTNGEKIEALLYHIREAIPEVTLRTSLIVGFPGETKEDFDRLTEFVKQAKFDKLGAFTYSKEEGTPAAKLPNQIHGNTKKARYNKIMAIQQEISRHNLEEKIGKIYPVLVEDISFDGKYLVGRTMQDVPEIDGLVYIESSDESQIHQVVNCKILAVSDYDLMACIEKEM